MTAPLHIYNLIFLSSAWSDVMCKTTAQADIVLLVDGSWSIGRLNFKTIRAFIARMVGVFDIGPDRVQIGKGVFFFFFSSCRFGCVSGRRCGRLCSFLYTGLAQYSGDPKTEWHLNAHRTRDSLMEAVANLPYKGGNTMTGFFLYTYIIFPIIISFINLTELRDSESFIKA